MDQSIYISNRSKLETVETNNIEYIEVMGKICFIYLAKGGIKQVRNKLSSYEETLKDNEDFMKIHRAFIVNIQHIVKCNNTSVEMRSGQCLPISRLLSQELKNRWYTSCATSKELKTEENNKDEYRILLVDDNETELKRWSNILKNNNCLVDMVKDGDSALSLVRKHNYNCIVLDILLGQENGLVLAKEIQKYSEANIIFLSSVEDIDYQTKGFVLGGVDYITKNTAEELVWLKIKARLIMDQKDSRKIYHEDYTFDTMTNTLSLRNKKVDLSYMEGIILEILIKNPNYIFSNKELYYKVYGHHENYEEQFIHTTMSSLNEKITQIGHPFIYAVWGKGYTLNRQEDHDK